MIPLSLLENKFMSLHLKNIQGKKSTEIKRTLKSTKTQQLLLKKTFIFSGVYRKNKFTCVERPNDGVSQTNPIQSEYLGEGATESEPGWICQEERDKLSKSTGSELVESNSSSEPVKGDEYWTLE